VPPTRRTVDDPAAALFAAAVAVGLLHALDDAVVSRQPGVPLAQHLPALLVVTTLAALAVVAFRRAATGIRAALALTVGAVTAVNGAMHVVHVARHEVSASDLTGLPAAVAGSVLVAMAVWLPLLHRGERNLGRARRWTVRLLTCAVLIAVVPLALVPIGVGIVQTHKYREPIGPPPDRLFAPVTFPASDGLQLTGWYAPSRNGAAVLLVSSAAGDRLRAVPHAQMLARRGYGVLLYDARGSGDSAGSPNGYGWDWHRDVDGALDFLDRRRDVAPGRIGALGLSTGADVILEVAAHDRRVGAVVADGATLRSLADVPPDQVLDRILMTPLMATVQLLSGSDPGPPLVRSVARVAPTPLLLIASGSIAPEIDINRSFAEAAGAPVELWLIPDGDHIRGLRDRRPEYERRVVGHFDEALLP
jgi:hypothetical protein